MGKYVVKIFIAIIVFGTAIYIASEFQNIVGSISGAVSSNDLIKLGTARNSDYFDNIISVGKKYNQR